MKVTATRNRAGVFQVCATWTEEEMGRAEMSLIDLAQLREPQRTGADILLDAELVVRRIEESELGRGPK